MKSRLSRPFDLDAPLYVSQEGQSSSRRREQSVRAVDPARYGEAYAQLTGHSKKSAQTPRKEQKVQYARGHRVKSQAAQGFKGDTLYFSS